MVSATRTGRSVYYSRSELVELAVMVYLLSVGLTSEVLQQLREIEPNFAKENSQRLWLDRIYQDLEVKLK